MEFHVNVTISVQFFQNLEVSVDDSLQKVDVAGKATFAKFTIDRNDVVL